MAMVFISKLVVCLLLGFFDLEDEWQCCPSKCQ